MGLSLYNDVCIGNFLSSCHHYQQFVFRTWKKKSHKKHHYPKSLWNDENKICTKIENFSHEILISHYYYIAFGYLILQTENSGEMRFYFLICTQFTQFSLVIRSAFLEAKKGKRFHGKYYYEERMGKRKAVTLYLTQSDAFEVNKTRNNDSNIHLMLCAIRNLKATNAYRNKKNTRFMARDDFKLQFIFLNVRIITASVV